MVARSSARIELPAELLPDVETYARVHGLSQSEAVRYLILAGLAAEARAMCAFERERRP